MLSIPLVESGPDHSQVHGPLNDLVVMTSLHEKAEAFDTDLDIMHPDTLDPCNSFQCNNL